MTSGQRGSSLGPEAKTKFPGERRQKGSHYEQLNWDYLAGAQAAIICSLLTFSSWACTEAEIRALHRACIT